MLQRVRLAILTALFSLAITAFHPASAGIAAQTGELIAAGTARAATVNGETSFAGVMAVRTGALVSFQAVFCDTQLSLSCETHRSESSTLTLTTLDSARLVLRGDVPGLGQVHVTYTATGGASYTYECLNSWATFGVQSPGVVAESDFYGRLGKWNVPQGSNVCGAFATSSPPLPASIEWRSS